MRIEVKNISDKDKFIIPLELMRLKESNVAKPQNIISPYIDLGLQFHRIIKLIKKPTSSILEQIDDELELLSNYYEYREKEEIIYFLMRNFSILKLIREAPLQIQKHFGPYVNLAIEIVSDAEVENFKTLFIYIKTKLDIEEALERLDKIDEEWNYEEFLFNEDPEAISEFEINLEFEK